MNDLPNYLKKGWKGIEREIPETETTPEQLISKANQLRRDSLRFQWGNILILTLTLVAIIYCWLTFFPFQDTLSKLGIAFMLGSLSIRILGEGLSILKGSRKSLAHETHKSLQREEAYLKLRKLMNGPLTYVTVSGYSLGFFFLAPEFSKYIQPIYMFLMLGSYVITAAVLIFVIRKNVIKEMENLKLVVALRQEIESD